MLFHAWLYWSKDTTILPFKEVGMSIIVQAESLFD